MKASIAASLILALHLASAAYSQDGKANKTGIQGTWKIVSLVDGIGPAPQDITKARVIISAETLTFEIEDGKQVLEIKLDPTTKPMSIDLKSTRKDAGQRPLLGIYQFDGDNLKICWDESRRPKNFDKKGVNSPDWRHLVLSREKQK